MSEQKIDSYRFKPGMEPTDEMLSQIMREAAQDANECASTPRHALPRKCIDAEKN